MDRMHPSIPRPRLSDDPQARPYRKRPTPVQVIFAERDGSIKTLEGPVAYAVGDAILSGVAGDRWPVGRLRFDVTYAAVPPTLQSEAGWYSRRPNRVLAKQQPLVFRVTTSNGAVLEGQPGDWLVEYGTDDQAIVAHTIFAATYEPIDN